MVGYSGTPLAKKLGIKPGDTVFMISAPREYREWLRVMPDARFVSKPPANGADVVHVFATLLAEFEKHLPAARKAMKADGSLWVSWHKKSAKISTDVTEDRIRDLALKTDLVDVKVCAVSDEWSGLKLVVRKHLR